MSETDPLTLRPTLLSGTPEDLTAGRPLLLVGPSLGTGVGTLWERSLPHLADDFAVVGWDLPGHAGAEPSHGPFTIDDLADAVDALSARLSEEYGLPAGTPIVGVGVSIAGAVSLTLAVREHARFSRLAAICTAARIGDPDMWQQRADLVSRAGTPTMVEGAASRWFAPGFMADQPSQATSLLQCLQHTERHSYAHACRALGRYDLSAEMGRISRPLLVLSGAEDTVCPPESGEAIAAGSPAVRLHILDGVAHQAPAEAPETTARLLKEFLHD